MEKQAWDTNLVSNPSEVEKASIFYNSYISYSNCKCLAKLIILASNCAPLRKSEVEYYAMLAQTHVHHYSGSKYIQVYTDHHLRFCSIDNIDLGTACGKFFRVGVLAITDPGDAELGLDAQIESH